jgi:hypothetical protein
VDILFLHDTCVTSDNPTNNKLFTNGYGFGAHAYLVTRSYIHSIITRYDSLPQPSGRHIDFEIMLNIIDKENALYSEKLFFTRKKCFSQLIDKSDNYINKLDELFRMDMQKTQKNTILAFTIAKKMNLLDDDKGKVLAYIVNLVIT